MVQERFQFGNRLQHFAEIGMSVVLLPSASPVDVRVVTTLPTLGISIAEGLEGRHFDPNKLPVFEIRTRPFANAFARNLSRVTVHEANFANTLILLIGDTTDVASRDLPAMSRSVEFDVPGDRLEVK